MLLALATGPAARAGERKGKPAEAPPEESVVPYPSRTHGALQVLSVSAKPADWFDVLQKGKRALAGNPPRLNSTLELAPGAYLVSVNRTQRRVTIQAGKKRIVRTGELVVKGAGDWYTPYQGKERKLVGNPPPLNRPVALFPGTYTVFVRVKMMDKSLGKAKVGAGRKTVLKN